mmetsp:Transcript_50348/g.90417  ORF Transcript_50348/g.90417 Transcript_50348/m.90417 type:complete len:268 (-) Transcript_50348:613-1416(-)
MCHGDANQLVVLLQTPGQCCDAGDKAEALIIILSWIEPVDARICAHRPVVVLSVAIDASEGLLMEKNHKSQLLSLRSANLHENHVVITGGTGNAENGRHLVLTWCNLIVPHCHRHANLKHLGLNNFEKAINLGRDWAEVVQIHLLIPLWKLSEECSASIEEVRALLVQLSRDHEELLLPADVGVHNLGSTCLRSLQAHGSEQSDALSGHGIGRSQERCFQIDAFAIMSYKAARNAHDVIQDEDGGRPIPHCEGCCSVSGTQTAIGEG